MNRLYGDAEYTYVDEPLTTGMVFVTKYLRMKHVLLFRLSNDVLQVCPFLSLLSINLSITFILSFFAMDNVLIDPVQLLRSHQIDPLRRRTSSLFHRQIPRPPYMESGSAPRTNGPRY